MPSIKQPCGIGAAPRFAAAPRRAALLAVLASVALAGCGSSASPSRVGGRASSSTSTTATASESVTTSETATTSVAPGTRGEAAPKQEGSARSKAQAERFAHAVNLRVGDLAGYAAESEEHERESASGKRATRRFAICLGVNSETGATGPHGSGLAEASSPQLGRKAGELRDEMIQSTVMVFGNAEGPRLLNGLFAQRSAGHCIANYLQAILGSAQLPEELHQGPIEVHQFAAPADAFGWRTSSYFASSRISLPFEMTMLGFSEGRGYVLVFSFALGKRFDPQVERHAVSLLMERARSHSL